MTTKDRIVAAAEVMFARNGYDGTSLRDITEMAGANVAAVNYHFGSKENLLIAVLNRVVVPINDERIERLNALEAAGNPDVMRILEAFLLPDLHALQALRDRNPTLPRFVSRMYGEGSKLMNEVVGAQFAVVRQRFNTALARALPRLDVEEIDFRLYCIVGIVVYLFAGVEGPGLPGLSGIDIEEDLSRLLHVAGSIMNAPNLEEVAPK